MSGSHSPKIDTNAYETTSTRQPQQSRGDGHRSSAAAGRIPVGGRTLVNPGIHRSHGNPANERGNAQHANNLPQSFRGGPGGRTIQPIQIHQNSGIPFGHVPAYLPGSASLVEQLDQRILIVLRDGKHLIGVSDSPFSPKDHQLLFFLSKRHAVD
jgi:hypothetical protein